MGHPVVFLIICVLFTEIHIHSYLFLKSLSPNKDHATMESLVFLLCLSDALFK